MLCRTSASSAIASSRTPTHVVTVAVRCKRVAVAVADPPIARIRSPQKNGSVQSRTDNPRHTCRSRLENRPALRSGRSHPGPTDHIPRAYDAQAP